MFVLKVEKKLVATVANVVLGSYSTESAALSAKIAYQAQHPKAVLSIVSA